MNQCKLNFWVVRMIGKISVMTVVLMLLGLIGSVRAHMNSSYTLDGESFADFFGCQ
jgi:hypothetical protein